MTYDEKLAFLRRYRDAQRTMRRCMEELEQLRSEAASVSQALSGIPSGGGDGQAIPRAVERIADAERRICAEIRRQLHGVHIRRPVVMRYLWVEPDRRRDRDNITAGRKFVQDALVRCKVLQNDGWKEIAGFADDWAVDKARPWVEIEIIEMED